MQQRFKKTERLPSLDKVIESGGRKMACIIMLQDIFKLGAMWSKLQGLLENLKYRVILSDDAMP